MNVGIMIVPTGIGASIGGYAGDASSQARLLSKEISKSSDGNTKLIVNPNIVNAAVFSGITDNMLYVEGSCIEEFVNGKLGLIPSENNKIGIVFDKAIPKNVLNVHLNTINAIKTIYDIDIVDYEITKENVGVEFFNTKSNISSGSVNYPETLVEAGKKLLEKGAQVLAIVCFFEEPPEDDYENGQGVDIVGGVEAILSRYVTKKLGCPCVHAPAFADINITDEIVSPKVSSEYITPTFLPCLLFGLKNAPLLVDLKNTKKIPQECITKNNLKFVVSPYNSLGNSVILNCTNSQIPVFAIKENKTVLNVDKTALGLSKNIIETETYKEALSKITAL